MNNKISQLCLHEGIVDCLCDPYDQLGTGDPYSSIIPDVNRVAAITIKECVKVITMNDTSDHKHVSKQITEELDRYFGGIEK